MTKPNKRRDEAEKKFDHPCKGTCSGWKQGYDKGYDQALLDSQERMKWLEEVLETIADKAGFLMEKSEFHYYAAQMLEAHKASKERE